MINFIFNFFKLDVFKTPLDKFVEEQNPTDTAQLEFIEKYFDQIATKTQFVML